jgi:pSer/pThr/pTyr-binding forkhead associated (FHA) protein
MSKAVNRHQATPAELKARIHAANAGTAFLVLRDGQGEQQIVRLDATMITIGRARTTDVQLEWDLEVSRVHAELVCVGSAWTLSDDGMSRNGSFVNGERVVGRRALRDGDRLVFGDTPVTFRAPADAADSTNAITLGAAPPLTEAQRKILVALCRPLKDDAYATPATNRDIAAEVHLSVDAVKAHLRVIFERFGLDDLPQNVKRARLAATALVNGVVRQHDF